VSKTPLTLIPNPTSTTFHSHFSLFTSYFNWSLSISDLRMREIIGGQRM